MKRFIASLVIVVMVIAGIAYRLNSQTARTSNDKPKIIVSFYPIAEFTKSIAGDSVEVLTLVPAGSEPHDFEPTPRQMAELTKASLFIYNGAGFEGWIDEFLPELKRNSIKVVNISDYIPLISVSELPIAHNPHYWIDPVLVQKEINAIRDALSEINPKDAKEYENRAREYVDRLIKLDSDIENGLSACVNREIITAHDAFGYYARRYNLNNHAIAGLSPEDEPSPLKMAEITKLAKEKNIKYILFESLVNNRFSDTIAKEVGAQTLIFNPIESLTEEQIEQGYDYFILQHENLNNLKIALGC